MSIFNKRLLALYESNNEKSRKDAVENIEAATSVAIPQTTFIEYLKNTEPKVSVFAAIAKYYNVSMEWLAGETDDRRPHNELVKASDLPSDIKLVTRLLMEMPKAQRDEAISLLKYKHAQWKALGNLIATMKMIDRDGSLSARVEGLSGIDPNVLDSISDLVGNNLFGDGDAQGRNEQVGVNAG